MSNTTVNQASNVYRQVVSQVPVQSQVMLQVSFVMYQAETGWLPGAVIEFQNGTQYLFTDSQVVRSLQERVEQHVASEGAVRLGGYFNQEVRNSHYIRLADTN